MQEDVLNDCRALFELMRRFWSSFGHQMNIVLQRGGINVPQYMAMVSLADMGEATMSDLSRKLHVTMGASTNIVDKLIRGGYVTRARGTDDRRIVRVKLLPKGQQALQDVEEKATHFMLSVLSEVEPERRKQFIESYGKMVKVAEATETTEALKGESVT
jgi:DNA-binding MarR family transcriptional regulator